MCLWATYQTPTRSALLGSFWCVCTWVCSTSAFVFMCLRLRLRTGRVIRSISSRRNYSNQVLLDNYSDSSCESTEIYRNPTGRDSWESGYRSESYSFIRASCLQHWFKNWQEQRKYRLTASTFAGVIGFWPRRRVQLWLEKIGALEPFPGNLATCWNNIKEEEALERYKLITGNDVMLPKFQVYGNENREDDWLGASPDGIVENCVYGLPSRGVLEIKCPYFNGDMKMAMPWKRIPLYHIPQAQGLMEIMDRDWMDFYVWTPNGSSLFRLYRDAKYWQALQMALADFWWIHVQPARELYSRYTITDPLSQLHSLKPAPRHELCSSIVYESKRIVDNSKLLVREIHGQLQN